MCILAWSWDAITQELLLIANRDEFYARPTKALHWWEDRAILAGKDLQAGGTWMGVSKTQNVKAKTAQDATLHTGENKSSLARLAALTNFRDPAHFRSDAQSRGNLVVDFLQSGLSAMEYVASIAPLKDRYNAYNLLLFDGAALVGYESHSAKTISFTSGVHAVSNAGFDTSWPKVEQLKCALRKRILQQQCDDENLFKLLHDAKPAQDALLPDTGVGIGLERLLSPIFIQSAEYGTRASSIVRLRVGADGSAHGSVTEQSFEKGCYAGTVHEQWAA